MSTTAPFVLDVPDAIRERHGNVDLYLPGGDGRHPAIVFVHGGPIPPDAAPTPRDWPVYRGYGNLAAASGAVGVTVDHRLHSPSAYPDSARDVADAVAFARAYPRVDPDRVAVWVFSGGGLLLAEWLRDPPPWLRCLAATYPRLVPKKERDVDPRYRPIQAVGGAAGLRFVLTRAGREEPELAGAVEDFLAAGRAAGVDLAVVDVPHGRHGFDMFDHTDESRAAVREATRLVVEALA
jgi:acetyl esterase/lipase